MYDEKQSSIARKHLWQQHEDVCLWKLSEKILYEIASQGTPDVVCKQNEELQNRI